MENDERRRHKGSKGKRHEYSTINPRKRKEKHLQEADSVPERIVSLSASTVDALVEAIAKDDRFNNALNNLSIIAEKLSADYPQAILEPHKNEIEYQHEEHDLGNKARIAEMQAQIAELETRSAEKQAQFEQQQTFITQLEAQCEDFKQRLIKRNGLIDSLGKERDIIAVDLQRTEKNAKTMENALNGISASGFGAINQPLSELELRLSTAYNRKKASKNDLHAVMTAVSSLRAALNYIDIGGGYSIEIDSCVDEGVWLKQSAIPYDDNIHSRGEPGQQVLVRSRGFKYVDGLGEERIIRAEVSPANLLDDHPKDGEPEEVSARE